MNPVHADPAKNSSNAMASWPDAPGSVAEPDIGCSGI